MAKRKIMWTRSTLHAWTIETGLDKPRHLLKSSGTCPALYDARVDARVQLARLKAVQVLPRAARAVRVSVTVTTIGRG